MKTIEEYMALPYSMEFTPDVDEGGYVVRFPDLKGCLSCGETLEDAVRNAEDAKREWLSAAMESGVEIPVPDTEADYSGQFKLRIPGSLHRALAINARREGVSMNQYCVYLLSLGSASHT